MTFDQLFTVDLLIRVIAVLIGTAAFSVIFHVRLRLLPYVILGGGITYVVYYFTAEFSGSVFVAGLLSSMGFSVYSEVLARIKRAPAAVFLLPSAIPIVPGGSLYHTMSNLLSQNYDRALDYLLETLQIGIGIAGGMAAISLLANLLNGLISYLKKKKEAKTEQKKD